MDTFEDWLDNMFAPFALTPAITRARNRLREQMKGKMAELREAGKSEEEATEIVIEQFGDLERVARELDIEQDLADARPDLPTFDYTEAAPLIREVIATRTLAGAAVALFFLSPLPLLWLGFSSRPVPGVSSGQSAFFGALLSALAIAAAFFLLRRRAGRLARHSQSLDGRIPSIACEHRCRREAWEDSRRWHNIVTTTIGILIVAGVPLFGVILVAPMLGISLTLPVLAAAAGFLRARRDTHRAPLAPLPRREDELTSGPAGSPN
ncbi:MAG: permease prefix domain 1-containing protein [Flaviflexus sp.]|nr:permease prefix domain 1-containing protein [Flaviflexus sp.]